MQISTKLFWIIPGWWWQLGRCLRSVWSKLGPIVQVHDTIDNITIHRRRAAPQIGKERSNVRDSRAFSIVYSERDRLDVPCLPKAQKAAQRIHIVRIQKPLRISFSYFVLKPIFIPWFEVHAGRMHHIASRTANWFRRVFRPHRSRYHDPLSDHFTFHIRTEYLGHSQVKYGSAIALLDTGCPYNIISRSVVKELGCTLLPVTDTSSFYTFKGEVIEFVGEVTLRWGCTTAHIAHASHSIRDITSLSFTL